MPLYIGRNIRANPPEALSLIEPEQLLHLLSAGDSPLVTEVARLRKLAQLDKKAYATAKLGLPYLIGATFGGNIRNTDNFEAIHYLVLDFDQCLQSPVQSQHLRQRIALRSEVWLMFVSPNGSGLKVWFRLQEPCTDPLVFKEFYRAFSSKFAEDIDLLGTLDTRTCDVTRVCFLSHDSATYYAPKATPLNWQHWQAKQDEFGDLNLDQEIIELPTKPPLNAAVYQQMLQKVNPKAPARPRDEPHVPALVESVQAKLVTLLEAQGIGIEQLVRLPYGLKFCCMRQLKRAEVSVFYGKRGFSVVKTPKSGTDSVLTDEVYTLMYNLLFE